MLSIGQFSRLTGLSQKTLIWYDNIGLLKPDYINEENGYRYYNVKSIEKVADIQFWQTLEFTINDIKNLSTNLIDGKIEQLKTKIVDIERNIYLLREFKEGNMKNLEIFNERTKAFSTLACGKWSYVGDFKSLSEILNKSDKGIRDENMPKYLFFGDYGLGTDLIDTFNYHENTFLRYNDIEYNFFLFDGGNKMIVYHTDTDYGKSKTVKLHLYRKSSSFTKYTNEEIEKLVQKYSEEIGAMHFEFNKNFVGNWAIYDTINESQIDNYDGKVKEENVHYFSHLYDVLDIQEDKTVYIMKKEDVISIEFTKDDIRELNRENTKMTAFMSKTSENEFILHNEKSQENIKCVYKKIGKDEYIFADLNNSPDLDVKVYVFKKQK